MVVAPGDQRGARRRAQRGREHAVVAKTLVGDPVHRRRRDHAAEGARHAETGVVRDDQQHVGRLLGRHDARRPPGLGLQRVVLDHAAERRIGRGKLLPADRRRRARRARRGGALLRRHHEGLRQQMHRNQRKATPDPELEKAHRRSLLIGAPARSSDTQQRWNRSRVLRRSCLRVCDILAVRGSMRHSIDLHDRRVVIDAGAGATEGSVARRRHAGGPAGAGRTGLRSRRGARRGRRRCAPVRRPEQPDSRRPDRPRARPLRRAHGTARTSRFASASTRDSPRSASSERWPRRLRTSAPRCGCSAASSA